MGQELVPMLAQDTKNNIIVTSRKEFQSQERIEYVKGNAKDIHFIKPLLESSYFDVIVDFMLYSVEEFKDRYELLLSSCKQYIFFSSSRVYAASDKPINEKSARLFDVSTDKEFLKNGEYSLTKAKEEDLLKDSKYKNWVIVRPYKTYSNNRLQLGVLEMEEWLYRAMEDKTVVVLGDIEHLHTSLTNSKDTAKILLRIIGDLTLNGEIFQIANPERITWGDVIKIYSKCIKSRYGRRMKVCYKKDTVEAEIIFDNKYRIKYDGLIDRIFDDGKIVSLMGEKFSWTPLSVGLSECVNSALELHNDLTVSNYGCEGMYDRVTREHTHLYSIPGNKNRFKYLLHRIFNEKTIKRFKGFVRRRENK